jgi:O-antigen/teichoic acid export membrane protein
LKPFDTNGVFAPAVPEGGHGLRRAAVRGAGMTVLSSGLSVGIQMIATVVLARMLAPRDFGLVTMVTTFSLLLSNFGLNGFTEAVVQREQMDSTTASNLFWMTLGGGLLLTLAFAAAGSLVARFYGEPLVAPICAAMSLTVLLSSASVLHLALLKRAMLFPTAAKNDIVAKAVSVTVSIFCACWGWGYWALVAGACALPLSTCIGAWYLCRWIPGRPRAAAGTGAMLKFGLYTYGRFTVNYFAHNSDNLLVGWRFGAVALGFYKKAYDLFSLSGSQLTSSTSVVAVAALSRVREDRAQYIRNLMGAMSVMALLGMAISGDLTLVGKDLIRVLLGPHWGTAGQIFTYFAPGIGVMFLYGAHGWIHLSIGRADRWFRWGIVEWTVTILLFLGGLHWGPQGIAVAWCISFWALTVPAMWYAGRPIGLGVGPMLRTVWRYVLAALAAYAASLFILVRWATLATAGGAQGAALRIAIVSLVFALLYLGAVIALHGGLAPLERLLGLMRDMAGSRWPGKTKAILVPVMLLVVFALHISAQTSAEPRGVVDWSQIGVGGIPPRTEICASLNAPATVDQINAALAACPSGQTVYLAAGTYAIKGTVRIPSNVTLRGAGADRTILNATGSSGDVVSMGSGSVAYRPVRITGGATTGSRTIEMSDARGLRVGSFLVIAESNDPAYVSAAGSGGNCNWCDGWTNNGRLARGQIVAVTAVSGNSVSIAPALYSAYTLAPIAVPFEMAVSHAGVENLQVYANNSGYGSNFSMKMCAYCWIKGVESNYADGDHVEVYWGFRDEIRDSYFSNAFLHGPGIHDSDLQIGWKTTASLVENNIIERTHAAIMLEWGAAGNVIAYNYTMGEFDSGATNLDIGGIDFHGAHPQFNLLEGNVLTMIDADSVWGTSSDTTAFRNWVIGTNRICGPMSGRGTVQCAGANGHYGFQAARAIEFSYLSKRNILIGNVLGSAAMQSLFGYHSALRQQDWVEYPASRSYDGTAYGWSFGYGGTGDDGSGTGCGGGVPPCHRAGATDFLHGNYDEIVGSTRWVPGVTHVLPASIYLKGKPPWWGSMPFPATGPDVSGGPGPGGHSYGNPAQACYLKVMGGSDGGTGGPLRFNAERCYGR